MFLLIDCVEGLSTRGGVVVVWKKVCACGMMALPRFPQLGFPGNISGSSASTLSERRVAVTRTLINISSHSHARISPLRMKSVPGKPLVEADKSNDSWTFLQWTRIGTEGAHGCNGVSNAASPDFSCPLTAHPAVASVARCGCSLACSASGIEKGYNKHSWNLCSVTI